MKTLFTPRNCITTEFYEHTKYAENTMKIHFMP